MSQHDFTIANQTASSARSDINSGLQALASNNSGASAPSTTYANQWWYDTGANILKIRNEADTAWVNVAYVNQSTNKFEILDDTKVVNTSGTQIGILGDQSTATWQTGTGTNETLVSPAKVRASVDTAHAARVWRSSDITSWSSGSTYTISHPLGVRPYSVQYELECKVAHYGAAVGDVVVMYGGERYTNWGIQTTNLTSTNITYSLYSAGFLFRDKGNSGSHARSSANWNMRVVLMG